MLFCRRRLSSFLRQWTSHAQIFLRGQLSCKLSSRNVLRSRSLQRRVLVRCGRILFLFRVRRNQQAQQVIHAHKTGEEASSSQAPHLSQLLTLRRSSSRYSHSLTFSGPQQECKFFRQPRKIRNHISDEQLRPHSMEASKGLLSKSQYLRLYRQTPGISQRFSASDKQRKQKGFPRPNIQFLRRLKLSGSRCTSKPASIRDKLIPSRPYQRKHEALNAQIPDQALCMDDPIRLKLQAS